MATNAGLVVASGLTATPTPNNAPTISSTPAPSFTEGVASEYDLDQHMADVDGDALTASISGSLPSGVTLRNNSNDNALVYDGVGADVTSTGHTLTANDGTDNSSASSAFSIIVTPVSAADIIVRKDGAGDYTTVQAALAEVTIGQTIEIQATTLGGSESFTETLTILFDGGDGSEITLRGRSTDSIRIFAASGANTLSIASHDYWIFQNITFGDSDLTWIQGSAANLNTVGGRGVSSGRNLHITGNSSFLDFQDCKIWGAGSRLGVSLASHFNFVDDACHHIRFLRCDFELAGTNNDLHTGNLNEERGDLAYFEGSDILYDACTFARGGHDAFVLRGSRNVVRNCTYDQDWTAAPFSTGFPGARGAEFSPSDNRGDGVGPLLVEGCIFKNAGATAPSSVNSAHKMTGDNCIFRNNYYWDNDVEDFNISNATQDPNNSIQYARYYHNTSYQPGQWIRVRDTGPNTTQYLNHEFRNNIVDGISRNTRSENANQAAIYWDANAIAQQGTPDNWIGAEFHGNLVSQQSGSFDAFLVGPNTLTSSVTSLESVYPLVFFNNIEGAATFVNAGARTKAGFQLASGNGVNAAVPLANVTTTENSTTISLDDVRWLYDGFDLSYFNESPDHICITATGTDPNVSGTHYQLTAGGRNTGTNEVTLTSSANVTNGDDVYLSDGTTAYTNVGAQEL